MHAISRHARSTATGHGTTMHFAAYRALPSSAKACFSFFGGCTSSGWQCLDLPVVACDNRTRIPARIATMTTCRRLLLFGLFAGLLALAAWLAWPRTAITPANAARFQEGMTLAQVEAIMGGPPRREGESHVSVQGPQPLYWEADNLLVCVWCASEGIATQDGRGEAHTIQIYDHSFHPLDAVRKWLRL
jgi:hypothetical protein